MSKELKPFRAWCYKVLPLVYDESLSYYELLCKVIEYLNNTIEVTNETRKALEALEKYVKDYFKNLDVQDEINNKLDEMAESGELQSLFNVFYSIPYGQYNTAAVNVVTKSQKDARINGGTMQHLANYSQRDDVVQYCAATLDSSVNSSGFYFTVGNVTANSVTTIENIDDVFVRDGMFVHLFDGTAEELDTINGSYFGKITSHEGNTVYVDSWYQMGTGDPSTPINAQTGVLNIKTHTYVSVRDLLVESDVPLLHKYASLEENNLIVRKSGYSDVSMIDNAVRELPEGTTVRSFVARNETGRNEGVGLYARHMRNAVQCVDCNNALVVQGEAIIDGQGALNRGYIIPGENRPIWLTYGETVEIDTADLTRDAHYIFFNNSDIQVQIQITNGTFRFYDIAPHSITLSARGSVDCFYSNSEKIFYVLSNNLTKMINSLSNASGPLIINSNTDLVSAHIEKSECKIGMNIGGSDIVLTASSGTIYAPTVVSSVTIPARTSFTVYFTGTNYIVCPL